MLKKVALAEKFSLFNEHWTPKLVTKVDNYEVKVVKVLGEFVWHKHDLVDELFMVIAGQLTIKVKDQEDVVLNPVSWSLSRRAWNIAPLLRKNVSYCCLSRVGLSIRVM